MLWFQIAVSVARRDEWVLTAAVKSQDIHPDLCTRGTADGPSPTWVSIPNTMHDKLLYHSDQLGGGGG